MTWVGEQRVRRRRLQAGSGRLPSGVLG